jgi:hypothetical protein
MFSPPVSFEPVDVVFSSPDAAPQPMTSAGMTSETIEAREAKEIARRADAHARFATPKNRW